jgi:HD-like signal output (HDOD) protein
MSSLNATGSSTRENVLRLARKLPTAPSIFGRLGRLLNDVNADLSDIVKLVSVDAGLTARVIRLSNSVFFKGEQSVRTLEEAINRVGFREMHKVVGVAMTEQVFQSGLPVYNLTAEEMWENSVVTALAMENLARIACEDEGLAYTVGLLRHVGKLVLDTLLQVENPGVTCPDSDTLDLPKWERAWTEITSNEIGAIILEEWKMPEAVHQGVKYHYQVEEAAGKMGALLHVACWITKELGKGIKAESKQWELTETTLDRAGVTQDMAQSCLTETQESLETLKSRLKAA